MSFANSSRPFFKRDVLEATAALNFASIAAGESESLNIAVPGAAVGDAAMCHAITAPSVGLVFQHYVSATNVVTVRATNVTASPIDQASASFVCVVIRA